MTYKFFGDAGGGDPQISKYFTLADLTRTDQSADNTPDANSLVNLNQLGKLLDQIYDLVGPFNVLSAFRSKAVEDALSASGQPTAEAAGGHVSFHTVGLAADINPTTMSLDEFFGKILAQMGTADQPGPLWNQMTEIGYKPSQGSIHVAGAVTYRAINVVLSLQDDGTYGRLSPEKILEYMSPYVQQAITDVEQAATSPSGIAGILAVGAALLALVFFSRKKRTA